MTIEDPRELDRVDRAIRDNERREFAREFPDAETTPWDDDDDEPSSGSDSLPGEMPGEMNSDMACEFEQDMLDWEQAPVSSYHHQLQERGVELPLPEALDDEDLHSKLWEVIDQLAETNTYLYQTDHLSDRELYAHLVDDVLHEWSKMLPPGSGWNCTLDILGGCSEEDMQLFIKYYADAIDRKMWAKDWDYGEFPAHVDPPYDRDRNLPTPDYGQDEDDQADDWLPD